jgi:two-component system, NtrC family, response regulator
MKKRLLIVDDEEGMRNVLARALAQAGYTPTSVESAEDALRVLEEGPVPPVVVSDLNMGGMDGLALTKIIKEKYPETIVLIITAYSELDSAVEAMRIGAYDYISKPFQPDLLVAAVDRAFEKNHLSDKVKTLSEQLNLQQGFEAIIGNSRAMRNAIDRAKKIAAVDEAVLVTGESGTGKELFARAIHKNSKRGNTPLIVVNCAAIPESLLESELFGHKKGAFTGATVDKTGLVQAANGGMIFFDEVGELPVPIQAKLLRFLQDHKVRRLGDVEEVDIDVRVIVATNKDLKKEAEAGRFRDDLFYRLRVLELYVPPLREHPEDIPFLLDHFLNKCENCPCDLGTCILPDGLSALQKYSWPGNVRELENLIKQLKVLCAGTGITASSLPEYLAEPGAATRSFSMPAQGTYSERREKVLQQFNREIISDALRAEGGNISRASESLGTAKSNLLRLMKKYAIQPHPKSS